MSDGHTLAWRALVESLHLGEVLFNSSGHQGHILCFQEKISPYLFFICFAFLFSPPHQQYETWEVDPVPVEKTDWCVACVQV